LTYSPGGYVITSVGDLVTSSRLYRIKDVFPENSIRLTSPGSGKIFPEQSDVTISAEVLNLGVERDSAWFRVDFFADTLLLGSDSIAPYTITWRKPSRGEHMLSAVAHGRNSTTFSSELVVIGVGDFNVKTLLSRRLTNSEPVIEQLFGNTIVDISASGEHSVKLLSINGRMIESRTGIGAHRYEFNNRNRASGAFIAVITQNNRTIVKRLWQSAGLCSLRSLW
jgi:hypothetical protein